jgi:hypothetical protein
MPTSKPKQGHKETITKISPPVDYWLDERKSALIVEMAHGERLVIDLTPEEFEFRRNNGMRVYDGRKDGPETDG